MPADGPASRMGGAVESVAGLGREVDAPDERDPVVDHDRLLVVAVHRALLRIECATDLRPAAEVLAHVAHGASRRPEERQRRAGPDQHAHLDPFRKLTPADCGAHRRRSPASARSRARKTSPRSRHPTAARSSSDAILGSASAPSIRTSSEQPGRGGGSPPAQPPGSASSAPSQPMRRSRRWWWRRTAFPTACPTTRSPAPNGLTCPYFPLLPVSKPSSWNSNRPPAASLTRRARAPPGRHRARPVRRPRNRKPSRRRRSARRRGRSTRALRRRPVRRRTSARSRRTGSGG